MSHLYNRIGHYLASTLLLTAATLVVAADYPTKPITLIVPTGAGGGTDLVARVMQKNLSDRLGQPIVIDNRVGAGGMIGTQAAARSAPDGYTLMMSSNQFAIISATRKSTPYDPVKDFQPITSVGVIPTVVVINPSLPIDSLQDLIAYAKRNPDKLQYGSAGVGSPNHLFGEMFDKAAGVRTLHVPYTAIAQALGAVVGGTISMAYASLPTVQGFIKAGKLKALAVTSQQRVASLPNLPAIAEAVPGYDADIWLGIWGVAGTPPAVIQTIHAALVATMNDADIKTRLADLGLVVEPRSPAQFEVLVNNELRKWAKVVDDSKGAIERQ